MKKCPKGFEECTRCHFGKTNGHGPMPEPKSFGVEAECDECNATGLYVGFAERDGAAVVCRRCKGAGRRKLELKWRPFVGRRERVGVKRVYAVNPGFVVGEGEDCTLEGFGGLTHEDWKLGVPFELGTEMRRYTCPAWWYQSVDYDRKPRWDECGFGRFSDCRRFPEKGSCWDRFDVEEAKREKEGS